MTNFIKIFVNDSDISWEEFINSLEKKFDDQQLKEWYNYWQKHGEEIILTQWKAKYRDYLAESSESAQSVIGCESEAVFCDQANQNAQEAQHTESWQYLWEKHNEEVLSEKYTLFTAVFYNYFINLKNSTETKNYQLNKFNEKLVGITAELEDFELLGLPNSFVMNTKKPNKMKRKTNDLSWLFSDDEDDSSGQTNSNNFTDKKQDASSIHHVNKNAISKKKKNRKLRKVPPFLLEEKGMIKYWRMRYSLFSRFDDGIRLDRESWFSVTPERVASHLAERLACDVLIDGFCGCGGNAIQFAKTCKKVIAVDIDPVKVNMAKHNAAIYGVSNKIDFIVADFLQIIENGRLQADIVFMSPPWGGPNYKEEASYDIERYLLPVSATELIQKSRLVSDNIALFLPRNSNLPQIIKLAGNGNRCEVEHNFLDTRLVGLTAIYGDDILKKSPLKT